MVAHPNIRDAVVTIGTCKNCKTEIHKKDTYCRPCAIGRVNNRPAYTEPCKTYVPELFPHLVKTCAQCGFLHA